MTFIKPCPFCGNTSDIHTPEGKIRMNPVRVIQTKSMNYGVPTDEIVFRVKCQECNSMGGCGVAINNELLKTTTTEAEAIEIAIKKWNTRKEG